MPPQPPVLSRAPPSQSPALRCAPPQPPALRRAPPQAGIHCREHYSIISLIYFLVTYL